MLSCTLSPAVKKIPHPSRKFRVLVKQKFQISWSFAALSLPSTSVSKADVKNHLWFTGHETISNTDMKSFPLSPVNKHQKQKISPVNDQRRSTHLLQSAWCLVRIPQWFRLYTWPYKNLPTLAVGGGTETSCWEQLSLSASGSLGYSASIQKHCWTWGLTDSCVELNFDINDTFKIQHAESIDVLTIHSSTFVNCIERLKVKNRCSHTK